MKKYFLFAAGLVVLGLTPAFAQFGPHGGEPQGPNFGGVLDKLFGDHQVFSAAMEFQTTGRSGNNVTMPGKLCFDGGKSSFEMNMSEMQGSKMTPDTAAHLKSMGMDTMISISCPDKKLAYLVYPGLHCYVEMAQTGAASGADIAGYKVETTELGKETVDGHDCVKNKVIVTDKEGARHESTVWNAGDLKDFPVKIVTGEQGQSATMLFKNISFDKPAAGVFDAPAGFTKYDNLQTMMQTEMMKKMGGLAMPAH
jgi:hypothetical protein